MQDFVIDPNTGLATFPQLKTNFGIKNHITYDNNLWGNMNPKFAKTDTERDQITQRDRKLANIMGTKDIVIATTPLDSTFIKYNHSVHQVLSYTYQPDSQGYRFMLLHANGVILTKPQVEVVFAPRDCPIFAFTLPNLEGCILLHLGAPQVAQNGHIQLLQYAQAALDIDLSKSEVFITPHICQKHYQMRKEKFQAFQKGYPRFADYATPIQHHQETKYAVDFVRLVKDDLVNDYGITTLYESNICVYEEAQKGHLYSYTLSKENEKKHPHSGFNVAFSFTK